MLRYRKTGNIHINGEIVLNSANCNSNQHRNTAHDSHVYFESEEGHYNANYQYKLFQITASQQSKCVNLEGRKAYQHRKCD